MFNTLKQPAVPPSIAGVAVVLGLLAGGSGMFWWQTHNAPPPGSSSARLLADTSPQHRNAPPVQATSTWAEQGPQTARDEQAWVKLGNTFMQKARETADVSYYQRAAAAFQQALALDPQYVPALVGMAWVSGARHEFEQSIAWARQAVTLEAQNQDAYGLLGDAAIEMGDYEAALEYYQTMLDLRPDLASYSRASHLLFLRGDVRKATWLMQKAIAAGAPYAENTAWCQAQLALMQWSSGAWLAAEQGLQLALQQQPEHYHLLAAMGRVVAAKQDYTAAIDYYKRALAITPHPEVIIALGDLYGLTHQPEEAARQYALLEAIQQLHRANGVRPDIQMARFYTDHDLRLPEALAEAEMIYQTRKNIFVADTLAWSYYKNGRYAEAKKIIKKALSLGTPDAQILFHAGMIHAQLDEQSTARQYLYQALSLNPHFHPLYATLAAETLQQLGAR
ncbi:MAG: tetratricopeptide repeat protein [Candidatus Tectimicrobiota bacterium]